MAVRTAPRRPWASRQPRGGGVGRLHIGRGGPGGAATPAYRPAGSAHGRAPRRCWQPYRNETHYVLIPATLKRISTIAFQVGGLAVWSSTSSTRKRLAAVFIAPSVGRLDGRHARCNESGPLNSRHRQVGKVWTDSCYHTGCTIPAARSARWVSRSSSAASRCRTRPRRSGPPSTASCARTTTTASPSPRRWASSRSPSTRRF